MFDGMMVIHSIVPKLMELSGLDPEKISRETYDAITF